MPVSVALRQLAATQDAWGAVARKEIRLILVSDVLVGGRSQEDAADWWRTCADKLDALAELTAAETFSLEAGPLSARLREIADLIESADLG